MALPTITPHEIRKIREELGMTRTEFAAELEVSENSVWGWEVGRRAPRLPTVRRIIAMSRDPSFTRYNADVTEGPPPADRPRVAQGPSLNVNGQGTTNGSGRSRKRS